MEFEVYNIVRVYQYELRPVFRTFFDKMMARRREAAERGDIVNVQFYKAVMNRLCLTLTRDACVEYLVGMGARASNAVRLHVHERGKEQGDADNESKLFHTANDSSKR